MKRSFPGSALLRSGALLACALLPTLVLQAGDPAQLDPRLPGFMEAKEQQARQLAKTLEIKVSSDIWKGFDLFQRGEWQQASNHFDKLMKRNAQYENSVADAGVSTPVWQPFMEVSLACTAFCEGTNYARAFGDDIISSIKPGSIYFGGTDPGRGLITALIKSHIQGDPFFVVTQNALADGNYLTYLREMYGKKIYIPSETDSQSAFQEYLADAQRRLQHDKEFPTEPRQLKPGEDVRIVDNRVQVSGQTAVMSINALLAKVILDKNPDREIYIEESFPLEWMYPHLIPHGLILKVERQPLANLSEEVLNRDQEFWQKYCRRLIGDWLTADTSMKEISTFVERVYRSGDLAGFKGDPAFARDDGARKRFSKLRSAQGGVYQWRALQAKSAAERERMTKAADLAFRQSYALCPYSPEAVFRYAQLLVAQERLNDALLMVYRAQKFEPDNQQFKDLAKSLETQKRNSKPSPAEKK